MNSKSGKSQRIRHNYTKIYALTIALVIIGGVVGGLMFLHFSNILTPPAAPAAETTSSTTETISPGDTNVPGGNGGQNQQGNGGTSSGTPGGNGGQNQQGSGGTSETPVPTTATPTPTETHGGGKVDRDTQSDDDFHNASPLSLINADHPMNGTAKSVNVYNDRSSKGYTLQLLNSSILLNQDALNALAKLNAALIGKYPEYQLLLTAGHTEDMMQTACTATDKENPKIDEHCSGYAFDCRYAVTTSEGTASAHLYDDASKAQTAFLLEEAAKLGIIQSKAHLDGRTKNDLRHLRYVGVPHAQYIYEHNLTLEAYLNELKNYNFNKRLELTDAEGTIYEIYYTAAKNGETGVYVPSDVPGGNYTIWSNNVDGFIVTIKTDKKAEAPAT